MAVREVILVVSTCGLGEFPANCKQTWLKLQSQDFCEVSSSRWRRICP